MNCPECGSLMTLLVESHREWEIGSNDELTEKQTTHFYRQCNRKVCRYAESDGIEVEVRKLPYYIIIG